LTQPITFAAPMVLSFSCVGGDPLASPPFFTTRGVWRGPWGRECLEVVWDFLAVAEHSTSFKSPGSFPFPGRWAARVPAWRPLFVCAVLWPHHPPPPSLAPDTTSVPQKSTGYSKTCVRLAATGLSVPDRWQSQTSCSNYRGANSPTASPPVVSPRS